MNIQDLLQVMQAQCLLMNELTGLERRMLSAVLDKDAAAVQLCNERCNILSASLAQAEDVRLALVKHLAIDAGIKIDPALPTNQTELLARLCARLGAVERANLSQALRNFKISIQQLVGVNQGLQSYTEAQLITLNSFLTELLPERNNGVYGSDGKQSASGRPQLFKLQA